MDADHFKTVVGADGSLVLSGLPPSQAVEVVVVERQGAQDEMQSWFQTVRTRHAFANMSKAEILEILRQTREAVWTEQHAS
jgi:hypothetical protein